MYIHLAILCRYSNVAFLCNIFVLTYNIRIYAMCPEIGISYCICFRNFVGDWFVACSCLIKAIRLRMCIYLLCCCINRYNC